MLTASREIPAKALQLQTPGAVSRILAQQDAPTLGQPRSQPLTTSNTCTMDLSTRSCHPSKASSAPFLKGESCSLAPKHNKVSSSTCTRAGCLALLRKAIRNRSGQGHLWERFEEVKHAHHSKFKRLQEVLCREKVLSQPVPSHPAHCSSHPLRVSAFISSLGILLMFL